MKGYVVLVIITAFSLLFALYSYMKSAKTIKCMEHMVDNAVDGTFLEHEFSEEKMSRLESKLYRYINKGERGHARIQKEKENIESLISDISHQTKTPLANILLYTQLLNESSSLSTEERKLSEQIGIQTEKLSFLISSLVKASRLETGIIAVVPVEQRLEKMLNELYESFKSAAEARNISLNLTECINDVAVFDRKWTMEALGNILDNAIKYTSPGGKIEIISAGYSMFIRIDICDTGIGMTEQEITKAFQRFYRSPEVNDEKGVGIGLYLAREIIQKEGGYIKVTSKKGKGSVFSVFLPKK